MPEIVKAHVGETGPGADPDPVVVQPDALPRPALPRCRKHPSAGPLERIEDASGKGNDKGKVEALVKTARRRFMVPIPKVHDLSVLNDRLLARCLERLDALEAGGQAAALLAGYVPLSQTGSELLFDVFSRRHENGATIVTSNLPFQEWTTVFASERLTGALLDRITHHVHILEMNGESYRLKQSRSRRRQPSE